MLGKVRSFFAERDVLEVDCPAIVTHAPFDDEFISLMTIDNCGEKKFLHTSPEYGMKRLLSMGIGDIYQMSHVFRAGECGQLHNPEFTMIEWYRVGQTLDFLIGETLALLALFLPTLPVERFSYREAMQKFAQIDFQQTNREELLACLEGVSLPDDYETWSEDELLKAIMAFIVEPHLGEEKLTVIYDYPPAQAVLSRIDPVLGVARRFEVYYRSHELANGYLELLDGQEQRERFIKTNELRKGKGMEDLAPDEFFLQALERGLPDCVGVAVGFDRLLMLQNQIKTISEVLPFDWTNS